MMKRQWGVREYKCGDEGEILKLHTLVFGSEAKADWWQWRYKQNPAGEPVIVLAEAEQGIVGNML